MKWLFVLIFPVLKDRYKRNIDSKPSLSTFIKADLGGFVHELLRYFPTHTSETLQASTAFMMLGSNS